MPWIIALIVILLIVGLTRCFVISAMALKRDINKRFDDLAVRLESEANSTVDSFLKANAGNRSN
jgi:hypothetical protein